MDNFERLVRLLLEQDDYWTLQSHKVELTKQARRELGKPSMPRTEIDLLAFKPNRNAVLVLEVKSFLDSPGVRLRELEETHNVPTGRYKLFTCAPYREAVFEELQKSLVARGLCDMRTKFEFGLAAGNVYRRDSNEISRFFNAKGWFYLSPEIIQQKTRELAELGYENSPFVITAKVLNRR